MVKMTKEQLAEDIASHYLAYLEGKYGVAVEEGRFMSVVMLNRCLLYFNQPLVCRLDGDINEKTCGVELVEE